ncbi:MAG: hypothetical protein JWM57_1916 [Phycisphaerales bacterium]|nr:hypothetical protein [Phycisphaerales bacterium]
MNHRNLLPPHRQAAKRRERATRRWILINSVYAALLATAGGIYAYATAPADAPISAAADVGKLNARLVSIRQQTAAMNTNLRSILEVTDRPDWSVLLRIVAQSLGDDLVLGAVDTSSPNTATATTEPRRVVLSGVGRSQAAVTQFVLRIEALRLFGHVRLAQTVTQSLRGNEGVGFQLICTLPEGGQ